MKRRDFIKSSAVTGGSLALLPKTGAPAEKEPSGGITAAVGKEPVVPRATGAAASPPLHGPKLPDLSPARWIWYPSGRTLANTFVLFRRELNLKSKPRRATGWISAESRYKLEVNGRRLQWGPAPADPRWPEADPIDLTEALVAGPNVIGATVLYYGHGDGTWPFGKPGLLFRLEVEPADGATEVIASDLGWDAHLCRAWRPGQYKRWYLRALQEEFDANLYPYGWSTPGFKKDGNWVPAMELDGFPNKPALSTTYSEYAQEYAAGPAEAELRPRSIPLMAESQVPAARLTESMWLEWRRPPEEYFECRTPGAFRVSRLASTVAVAPGLWDINLRESHSAALTFEFDEQVVGWPYFSIEAPAGTVVELLVQEAHEPGGPPLLNTHFDSWTRFVCRQGVNTFECFDFESLRWLQLNVRGARGRARIRDVGVRRRVYPWRNVPRVRFAEPPLRRLIDASVNTLKNCAQETLVDGMARERQQYSGDGGHQTHALYYAFGETRQPARYLTTFSQGQMKEGFFLDCWPAYDRLARLVERQFGLTGWGPLLDHGVGFVFDCWNYYIYTGDLEALHEPYPRLLRFADYLHGLWEKGGRRLLPVEDIGVPSVWIDHNAYERQRHKQCAFNLYAAAMLENALAPALPGIRRQKTGEVGSATSAVTFSRPPSAGSGALSAKSSSTTFPGSRKKGNRGSATGRSRHRCSSTSARDGKRGRPSRRWPTVRPRWVSPTRPTPAGACGRWPKAAAPTSSSRTSGSAGRRWIRSDSTTRSRKTGPPSPTPAPSGAIVLLSRSISLTWGSPASGRSSPGSGASKSGRRSRTWRSSSSRPSPCAARSIFSRKENWGTAN